MFNRGIFRKEALERLSTPEQLDQLMQVTGGMSWLFLLTLGTVITSGLAWSIFGRIPITVEGKGVLIRPKRVIPVQSPISGQLETWKIEVGACVDKDEVLATVNPVDLKQQLQLANTKFQQLAQQNQETRTVAQQRIALEQAELATTRQNLTRRLQDAQALTPQLQQQQLAAIRSDRQSLQAQLADARALVPQLQDRLERRRELRQEGAIGDDTVLEAEQEFIEARQNIATLTAQLTQLNVQATETQQQYQDNLANIGDLQQQLQELDTRKQALDEERLTLVTDQTKEIQEVSQDIERLQQQVTENSRVLSPASGCLLEANLSAGQVLQPGVQLGTLRTGNADNPLVAVNYFAVKDGKLIEAGMPIQVTPDTVKRERFGGIVGDVKSVSAFPVTVEGVTLLVGNPEVAASLMVPAPEPGQDPAEAPTAGMIEVRSQLQPSLETVSGWQWSSSQGPPLELTSGTTMTSQVQVEERAPITFVLPILREWTGIY